MSLVHVAKAGGPSVREPLLKDHFFADQAKIDDFIEKDRPNKDDQEVCTHKFY